MKLVSISSIYSAKALLNFDCGNADLNLFFSHYAHANDRRGIGKTFVLIDKEQIVGFFTLSSAQIHFADLSQKDKLTLPHYPIPSIRISRLGVDIRFQKKGFGSLLLAEAFKKIVTASLSVGVYLVIVDAKEESKLFYEHYGFIHFGDKLSYYLPIATIIKSFK